MTWEMIVVSISIVIMLVALMKEMASPGFIIAAVLAILLITGILTPEEAFSGFSNEGMLTVALLFIVAGAVQHSGLIDRMIESWLQKSRSIGGSKWRLFIPIAMMSAFLNNTPIVVTFAPIIKSWCEKRGLASSKFLIPLSYVTIMGGTITLIGTSTNLVVHGMMLSYGLEGFSLFTLSMVGIPITIVGLIYILTIGMRILPSYPIDHSLEKEEAASLDSMMAVYAADGKHSARLLPLHKRNKLKGWSTLVIFIMMVLLVALGWLSMIKAMLVAVLVMFALKIIGPQDMFKSLQFQVLLIIACSLSIGIALTKTGMAQWVAKWLSAAGEHYGLIAIIFMLYGLTSLFTEFLTNSAAAAMMFPIGYELSQVLELNATGMAVLIAIAASASFITPIGYQTNLIVYNMGRYRFNDFVKVGSPLSLLIMITTVTIVYYYYF